MVQKNPSYFLVIGLGVSGLSMAKFLNARGKQVVATDIDAAQMQHAPELNAMGVKTEIGFHDQDTFDNAGILIPSPGIPLTSAYIERALARGVTLKGELDIFSEYNTLPVIAVTGTNGKTTTTSLIGEIARACGKNVFVGGNIGIPLVDALHDPADTDMIVAEISSFQLDISEKFRPDVGVLLNITEDHLDRYENFNAYEDAKWHIFSNQTFADTAVINAGIPHAEKRTKKLAADILSFSSGVPAQVPCHARVEKTGVQLDIAGMTNTLKAEDYPRYTGVHNLENMAAAVLACIAAGMDMDGIRRGLRKFRMPAHRLEFVKTISQVSFYNDSKATNTDAVIRALACFHSPIILILGGRQKGTDFSLLVPGVKKSVKTIIALGESAAQIKKTFSGICPVTTAKTMKGAVSKAFGAAAPKDVVLLSPACASFDLFNSYAHRGDEFISCVNGLKGQKA